MAVYRGIDISPGAGEPLEFDGRIELWTTLNNDSLKISMHEDWIG